MIRIGFLTGARSEYGIARKFLKEIENDNDFDLTIYPNGMHLLKRFGYTVDEIKKEGFKKIIPIKTYDEEDKEKAYEFTDSVLNIYNSLKNEKLNCVFIIGDRLEAYSAATACHFLKIPVIHFAGGTITKGAVDNIYRYNISNLSNLHFVTSKYNYNRLIKENIIDTDKVFFIGSFAMDSIFDFKKNPVSIKNIYPGIRIKKFALMTFHPVTSKKENIDLIMDDIIKIILENDYDVLITYPNNDEGHEKIIDVIKKWELNKNVYISKSLGAGGYYSALNDCVFVVGNSSSGIIEAPYFEKEIINIGSRQEGRDKDDLVTDVKEDINAVKKILYDRFLNGFKTGKCSNIYGEGNSVNQGIKIIKEYFSDRGNNK